MEKLFHLMMFCILLFGSSYSIADTVEIETADRRIAQATFLQGDKQANPILILHGFLQTREFSTVQRLANSLHESGYTVLAPTLTLGLQRRKQSLACEAIHTHSLDSDSAEISQWVKWLQEKTGKPVTLIGHSSGTLVLLNYLEKNQEIPVENAIFISMSYFSEGPVAHEQADQAERARDQLEKGYDPIGNYGLSYCKHYPTTASAFLSYYNWSREKVATTAARFANMIKVIIGTGDKRIDDDWKEQLKQNQIHVIAVEGANHFFDQAYEFDLLDSIEGLLENG